VGHMNWRKVPRKQIYMLLGVLVIFAGIAGSAAVHATNDPAFCTVCHTMQPMYDSYHNSTLLAHRHKDADVTCHDCHEPSLQAQMKEGLEYLTGTYEDPMATRRFPKAMCLKCHDMETVKARTNYKEGNPHAAEQECYQCHKMHEPEPPYRLK